MFTAFGGIKKREPLFTFKRKVPFSHTAIEENNKKVVSLPSPSSSNSSVELSQPKPTPKEPNIDDAIFDFPAKIDKKALEIKLMVASAERRAVPDTKLVKKKSKQKLTKSSPSPSCSSSTSSSPVQKTKKKSSKKQIKPSVSVPSSYEPSFDIFAFDPQPSSHLPHYTPASHTNILYHYQQPQPMYNAPMNVNNILNDPLGLNDVASLLDNDPTMPFYNTTPFPNTISPQSFNTNTLPHTFPFEDTSLNKTSLPQEPVEKKRKRNLVAHLKSANGEKENKPLNQGFDFLLSDEEDEEPKDILPLRDIITTRDKSPSPELSYQQKMELELEAIMRSEFGTKEKVEHEATSRPRYQPLNKVNVKVTFQKKK
ncbi:hypothetical protein CU098_009505 [Rhizopus stolonifer]|uniref:Uncharacterized protein n=1 Tax=Rhizopus stolonifer TaxID=4846 RepID=A0A367JK01_RHIST|nr:hypothetical protein CU098_009505 [Rhizopus stolonifer]